MGSGSTRLQGVGQSKGAAVDGSDCMSSAGGSARGDGGGVSTRADMGKVEADRIGRGERDHVIGEEAQAASHGDRGDGGGLM